MAFAIAAGRHPKFPTHQPITKSMYFLPRESVTMLPFVAATCSSAGSSLASGSRRRAGMERSFPYGCGDGVIIGDQRVRRSTQYVSGVTPRETSDPRISTDRQLSDPFSSAYG